MATFSHLYSSALDYELGTDDSTRLFTTARRKQCINEGAEQFADLTACLDRNALVPSSNGVSEYNLLSTVHVQLGDFLRLSAQLPEFAHISSGSTVVTYTSGENFQRRNVDWLNRYEPGWRAAPSGTPRYWWERAGSGTRFLGLYPPPAIGSSESAFVRIGYVAKAQTMTSDTEVPFTIAPVGSTVMLTRTDLDVYHQGIVHYAAHKLEKLRVNAEGSASQLQLFLAWVDRYKVDQRPKGGQTVRTSRDYFRESRQRVTNSDLPSPMRGWSY